jgi:trigger factor
LDVLAEKEEPEVTQDELNDHIVFTARRYGVEPQQFLMQLQQSGQLLNLVSDVRRGKALANAICSVTVKDSDGNDVDPKIYFGDEEETAQDSDES